MTSKRKKLAYILFIPPILFALSGLVWVIVNIPLMGILLICLLLVFIASWLLVSEEDL